MKEILLAHPRYVKKDARLSTCGKYRYQLWRYWNYSLPRCCFIMLNPSTADAELDDPTISKCARLAAKWGYGSLEVLNLFALRSTDPKVLKQSVRNGIDTIGVLNTEIILNRMMDRKIRLVVAAWGNHAMLLDRGDSMSKRIIDVGRDLYALNISSVTGQPSHPLYLKETLEPVTWKRGANAEN